MHEAEHSQKSLQHRARTTTASAPGDVSLDVCSLFSVTVTGYTGNTRQDVAIAFILSAVLSRIYHTVIKPSEM